MIKENDIVEAKRDLSDLISKNRKGAVLMIYQTPTLAYEVEFIDDAGETLEIITVFPDDIQAV
ncbi:DUF4926 domain-containing protein [Erwiniaceae bacterium L1_54_6]|jgi:hypothetical protein|nr:DUF4926 domain-containing protein [Erwiniaceae bacterium L1_54_6]